MTNALLSRLSAHLKAEGLSPADGARLCAEFLGVTIASVADSAVAKGASRDDVVEGGLRHYKQIMRDWSARTSAAPEQEPSHEP